MDDLEPIRPEQAIEMYLTDREPELAEATVRSQRSRLRQFEKWCEQEDITDLTTITGRDLHRYRLWRREDGDLAPPSEKSQMDTLRSFLRWAEKCEAAPQGIAEKVVSPSLDKDQHVREVSVDAEEAEQILDKLARYEYASLRHLCFRLLWRVGIRRGTLVALDVEDYDEENQHLEIKHRPETGTPLKLQTRGERFVGLNDETCAIINAWLDDRRPNQSDDWDRKPLLATSQGRIHPTTIQGYVYSVTKSCYLTNECPHGQVIEECKAARDRTEAYACPSSKSPHSIRRGALTHWLSEDIPKTVAGARASVTPEILDLHYDVRDEREKMEQRRGFLDNI